ncbi:MAG: CIA30 family protein [Synechococcaceae cyanobacterium SM2_3_1]|nr:CIA30 family protein [Synechococcaceae cyanobacterium SM2_3_1]
MPAWDLSRFLATLNYFDALSFGSTVQQVKGWLGMETAEVTSATLARPEQLRVLVAGTESQMGRRLVHQLLDQGQRVQILTPSPVSTQRVWGESVEILEATQLRPEQLRRTQALLVWLQDPHWQDPHFVKLEQLARVAEASWAKLPDHLLFDFQHPTPDLKDRWGALDDVVMGGVSESGLHLTPEGGLFTGVVSTANSGGFASIRMRNLVPPLDLSDFAGIELWVRGDGKRYKFFVRTQQDWDSLAYSISFDTYPETWQQLQFPFAEMIPTFRARTLADAPPLDPSGVSSFQLMLSKFEQDKQLNPHFAPGPFGLQIQTLGVYRAQSLPQLVVLTVAPSTEVESWLQAQGLRPTLIRVVAGSDPKAGTMTQFISDMTPSGVLEVHEVAEVCLQALRHPQAVQRLLSLRSLPMLATPSWDHWFQQGPMISANGN